MVDEEKSRLYNSVYNIIWSIRSNFILAAFGITSRAIFVRMLGDELMGVNSLFADVLLLFSFAEMGFGTAITFSLYKPIADNDIDKIKSLLVFYRNVYSVTAGIIAFIGLCFVPFLGSLKTDIPIEDLRVYYAIFLRNNIISYIAAYREAYILAKQQARKLVRVNTRFSLFTTLIQIVIVIAIKNFVLYLLANTILILVRKIIVNKYVLKVYPETDICGVKTIPKNERDTIIRKVKALAIHKIANLSISQTDSLIVSYMINVTQWGLVSNYLALKTTVAGITNQIYSALLPSMGDLVARENQETHIRVFYIYDFLNFWMYGFCFIALATLSSPFVSLLYGPTRVLDDPTVFAFFFSMFIGGLRDPISVLKEANGAYESDKLFAVLSAIVNLVVSVILASLIGLPGVFIGTICSTLVVLFARPYILFNSIYGISSKGYYLRMLSFIAVVVITYRIVFVVVSYVAQQFGITILSFVIMTVLVAVIPNLIWLIIFCRTNVFKSIISMVRNMIKKV